MIRNWLNIFLYQIKNNKLFTTLNILGLSIGIAGLIFAILYWNDEQSYNAWNPGKERVFQSICKVSSDTYWASNVGAYEPYLNSSFPELEAHCYLNNWYYNEILEYNGRKEIVKITDSQKSFFKFFPFSFSKGTAETALPDSNSIAISEQTASLLFGSEDPMGKQIRYGNKVLVVRGVYSIPGKSSMAPMAVTNFIDAKLKINDNPWGNFNHGLLLKLKNPEDKQKVANRMEKIMFENRIIKDAKEQGISVEEYLKKEGSETTKIILEPLAKARLHSFIESYPEGRGNYRFLLIMIGLSILILILSIVNYINLATANAIKRVKEVGVRKIIGASKFNIIRQFIFETTLIALFSILLALVIVELSLPYYNEFLGKSLVIHGEQFYVQLVIIFLFTIAVAGIFPAVYVSNFETLKVLKGNFGRSKSGVWLRNGMLILQFAIATFFIIGSYIVYEQVQYLNTKDIGFKGEQILSIRYRNNFDWREKDYEKKILRRYYTLRDEISKIKGVEQVSTGAFSFGNGSNSSSSFEYNKVNIQGQNMAIDFGMLEMMKIRLAEGRYLSSKYASDTINSMLINETAQKMMKEKNIIGKEINWNGNKLKVVGVVRDFNLYSPQSNVPPMVFFHFKTVNWMAGNINNFHVKLSGSNMEQTIVNLEKFWVKNVDSEYPFEYDFVDKAYARTYETYVKQKNLFSLLNFIVILIAVFGLFSLASYSIQRRMKEIAIRKTLGAETNVLLRELSKQYVVFCLIGFVIAIFPVYYLLRKWLEDFADQITITFVPFAIGLISLMFLTLIVVLSRAYQATKLDVLKYLKYE